MSTLQFNIDEDCLYSPLPPDVVDIPSDSEDAFTVEPGNVLQLEERFRINTTEFNLMTAFAGSSIATLFPYSEGTVTSNTEIDTTWTQIERVLMDLVEGNQAEQP